MARRNACDGPAAAARTLERVTALVALALSAPAQSVRSFEPLDEGLPSARVYAGVQFEDGRVAFAGDAGLAVYDGRSWSVDDRPDALLSRARFVDLGTDGEPWLGGHWAVDPILRRRDGSWSAFASPGVADGADGAVVAFDVLPDPAGDRLVYVTSSAAFEHDGASWRRLASREELGGALRACARDGDTLALGGEGGLALLREGVLQRELQAELARAGLADAPVLALAYEQGAGPDLWILAPDWVARARDGRVESAFRHGVELDAESVHRILPDGAGGLWVGASAGLWHLEAGTGELRAVRRDTDHHTWPGVNDFLRDREGVLWTSYDRGVHRIPSARFENWGLDDGLLDDDVTAVVESPRGRVVLAHPQGLSFLEQGRVSTRGLASGVPQSARILSLAADREGNLWIARARGGALRMAPDGSVTALELPERAIATSVLVDRAQRVWLTTFDGLFLWQDGRFVAREESICSGGPRRIVELRDGRLALATAYCGVALHEDGAWRALEHAAGGAAQSTYDLCLRADGTLLVASDAGVLVERDGALEHWCEGTFAVDEPVYAILEADGALWLGTRHGVLRWDGERARRFAHPQGLAAQEINRAGLLRDSRGRLWIGGVGGVSRYRPALERTGAVTPRLSLSAVVQDQRGSPPDLPLRLAHDQNDLEFLFHGISFADAGRVAYRFRLHGYDASWIEDPRAAEGGLARYTNLPPGEYRFEVAARAGDGPWGPSATTAAIAIEAPFWRSAWFLAAAAAVLASLGWGVNHMVLQRRRNALLDELVRTRTEQLTAAERGHREAFEQSRAPQLLIDPATGTIVAANRAAEEFYGQATLVGAELARFEVPAEGALPIDVCGVPPGAGRRFECTQRQACGTLREVELYASGYELAGARTVQVILHDVTERRQLQEKLGVAQRMESIGLLAGGIAHDFNNILTVILGNAELALTELDPEDASAAPLRGELLQIRESGQRAAGLTRQLLEFSRRRVVRFEPLDLNAVVRDLEPMARRLTREDIELELDLDPTLPPILAERSQMEQVVLNLVVNASEAMPGGGRIALRTESVELAGGTPGLPTGLAGRFALLEVSDDGVGMDAATARRIFEPFFSRRQNGHGTGLGLATLHGIVEQTGGRVEVDSAPGRGSVFRVWLPVAAGRPAPQPQPAGAPAHLRGDETILLCEDDDAVRELAARILSEHGYRVLPAALPSRALELAEDGAQAIDLLVTDVILPEGNGRELALAVAALRPGLPVLYVSGYTADVIARHGMLASGIELLHKPFRVPELLARVRALLDRRSSAAVTGPAKDGRGERI
jgi:signal transduction histidine kinase/ligand-binding sensor domain-containing protein/CheY-like chemotaxis protein